MAVTEVKSMYFRAKMAFLVIIDFIYSHKYDCFGHLCTKKVPLCVLLIRKHSWCASKCKAYHHTSRSVIPQETRNSPLFAPRVNILTHFFKSYSWHVIISVLSIYIGIHFKTSNQSILKFSNNSNDVYYFLILILLINFNIN